MGRIRRRSKRSLPTLKRKVWAVFSEFIKHRDGPTCFSCGRTGLSGTGWHAGHLFSDRAHPNLRYHPLNVHSQCYQCNVNMGGNGAAYTAAFIRRYGLPMFNELEAISRREKKWTHAELESILENPGLMQRP